MKLAISSQGKRRDAPLEPWFGRAACFLIVDTDHMSFDALENERMEGPEEINEINAARLVIDAGVEAVLTGNCGFEARGMLAAAGVKLFQICPETVEQAIEELQRGRLAEVPAPGIREPVEVGVGEDREV